MDELSYPLEEDYTSRTWAEVNLWRLEHNYKQIRSQLPAGCRIAAVCKANAYGHGAVFIARKLQRLGVDYICVTTFEEGLQLRQAGVFTPILVLGPTPAKRAHDLARYDLEQAVTSAEQAREYEECLNHLLLTLKIHIKLDTGMSRVGFDARSEWLCDELEFILREAKHLQVKGVFTHFAVSDEPDNPFTRRQYELFCEAVGRVERCFNCSLGIKHCANSGAVVNFPEFALDMVRPGLLLYGVYPGRETGALMLSPVMRLFTKVSGRYLHHKGDTVSYGRKFTCERDTMLAALPIGYADGLPRCLSGRVSFGLNGQRIKQVGTICMDMCMADVTGIDPLDTAAHPVEIFGDGPSVYELAERAGTIPYELLTGISPRVPRVYLGEREDYLPPEREFEPLPLYGSKGVNVTHLYPAPETPPELSE